MKNRQYTAMFDTLESRRLFAWSEYAQLVAQDDATIVYPKATGSGTTVAVIDTGIDYSLAALGGGYGKKYKVIAGYDFYANDSDPKDESGHGTAVASVIAGNAFKRNGITYQGVAPGAKLVALRVGTESDITDDNIERALRWVINNYKAYNISVVNLSLGSGAYTNQRTSAQMSDEFASLRELGVFVVAASGNSNDQQSGPISQDGIAYPSADPNVFAVGAVSASDVITTWSQRGDELDIVAAGEEIIVPKIGGGYAAEDGTSFAAPYVAGTAALIKQLNPAAKPGDIGSVLMSSGSANRDGDAESGNATGLLFSRLNIDAALRLASQRRGQTETLSLGAAFDTALDAQGVLHAAYYDSRHTQVLYSTRSISGLWSTPTVVDTDGDVGAQVSVAVDTMGKVGIGYYDATNTAIKYAAQRGTRWSTAVIDSAKRVGTFPSLGYSIDGDAYLAYYRQTGGALRMAHMDRDSGAWDRRTIDGLDAADVGAYASLDVGEAVSNSGPFSSYHTTVAIAYADSTNGDLKYARLDVDDSTATWYISRVDDTGGVRGVDLNLHEGPLNLGLQAQIGYVDTSTVQAKYAYRNTDWFVETVASLGRASGDAQITFDEDDRPIIAFFHGTKRVVYTATRQSSTNWTLGLVGRGAGLLSVGQNDRNPLVELSFLNRARNEVVTSELL
ncbi:MAG: S8 family serine peptidase [Burkholderiales bacterium]|nr:S8 family serine peptidase [Phycisphaerae bacterium]